MLRLLWQTQISIRGLLLTARGHRGGARALPCSDNAPRAAVTRTPRSGPAPQGTARDGSSSTMTPKSGKERASASDKVKVDEHATQHPIGVVDHAVDKGPCR